MIIPEAHAFPCCIHDKDKLTVNVAITGYTPEKVLFEIGPANVFIEDPEQVRMIRDMLTAWLSRPK